MSMYIDTKLDGIKSALRDELYETPSLEILKYHDSVPPEYIEDHMGLLQLSEAWVQAAENIVRMKDPQVLLDMWDLRNFQFLVQ